MTAAIALKNWSHVFDAQRGWSSDGQTMVWGSTEGDGMVINMNTSAVVEHSAWKNLKTLH